MFINHLFARRFLQTFIVVLYFIILMGIIYFQFIDYQYFVSKISFFYDFSTGQQTKFKELIFTQERFFLFQKLLFIFCIILGFTTIIFIKKYVSIYRFFTNLNHEIKQLFLNIITELKTLSKRQKYIFWGIFLAIATSQIFAAYFSVFYIDEVSSYLFFTSKGLWVCMAYYPNPNNHLFLSVSTWVLSNFIPSPFWIMKLPSLIASQITVFIVFIFFKKYKNFNIAILTIITLSLLPSVYEYAHTGRGYALQMLFLAISAFSILKITEPRNIKSKRVFHFLFILFSFLGFYTILTFIYFWIILVIFGMIQIIFLNHTKNLIIVFLLDIFLVFLLVFIAYLPVFLLNGFGVILNNNWIQSFDNQVTIIKTYKYFLDFFNFFIGTDFYGFLILIPIFFLVFFQDKNTFFSNNKTLFLCLTVFFGSICLMFLQGKMFPIRIFMPLSVVGVVILVELITKTSIRVQKITIIFSLLVSTILFINYLKNTISRPDYEQAQKAITEIQLSDNQLIYTDDDIFNAYLRLKAYQEHKSIEIEAYSNFQKKPYSWVILSKQNSDYSLNNQVFAKKSYILFIETDFVKIWKKTP
jgi:hypothetical protein